MALILLSTLPDGLQPLLLLDENFAYLLAQINAVNPNGTVQTITGVGTVIVAESDSLIVLKKLVAGATTIQLPKAGPRNGLRLAVADWAGNAGDITVLPAAGELIMGLAQGIWASAGQGIGTSAGFELAPIAGGWVGV